MNLLNKKRDQGGFTIVELLIVIVVIAILALLVVTTYGGAKAKSRDAKRVSDLQGIQTQLEAFFASNDYYPAAADLNSATWLSTNMKSLDANLLSDPSDTTNKTVSTSTATATGKQYGYVATHSDGTTACTTGDTQCSQYVLSAYLEVPKSVTSKNSLGS